MNRNNNTNWIPVLYLGNNVIERTRRHVQKAIPQRGSSPTPCVTTMTGSSMSTTMHRKATLTSANKSVYQYT